MGWAIAQRELETGYGLDMGWEKTPEWKPEPENDGEGDMLMWTGVVVAGDSPVEDLLLLLGANALILEQQIEEGRLANAEKRWTS